MLTKVENRITCLVVFAVLVGAADDAVDVPSRLSGRARLRRALTGHIELSSASVDDPEMQLGEVCV